MRTFIYTLAILAITHPAFADGPLYNTPVFDPVTKSYFALVDVRDRQESVWHVGYDWLEADRDAKRQVYNGRHGRLALVPSLHVHEFLELTFRTDTYTWIGLRYMCKTRRLEDSAGRLVTASFVAWARFWRQDDNICVMNPHDSRWPNEFMSVAYSPINKGFRWIGKGKHKVYAAYFIEFPTGEP